MVDDDRVSQLMGKFSMAQKHHTDKWIHLDGLRAKRQSGNSDGFEPDPDFMAASDEWLKAYHEMNVAADELGKHLVSRRDA